MRLVGLISRIFLLIAACSADQGDLSANQTAFFRSDDKVVTLKKSDTCETTLVNATCTTAGGCLPTYKSDSA